MQSSNRDPHKCRFADWRDAFTTEPIIGVLDRTQRAAWEARISHFPQADGLPGDPLSEHNPFSVSAYLLRTVAMARVLLSAAQVRRHRLSRIGSEDDFADFEPTNVASIGFSVQAITDNIARLVKYGLVGTIAGLIEALGILQMIFGAVSSFSPGLILQFLEMIAASARAVLRPLVEIDDELRWIWEITDLMLAAMVGIVRFGLIAIRGDSTPLTISNVWNG